MTRSRYSRSSRNWPAATRSLEVAVGGGDHAHVDARLRLIRPDGLDLAVLEKPQQERLHAQAHLADFVEEQRAAMRELELAALVAVGAGEAALDVSEELRLEQRLGQAGAVHGHERRLLAAEWLWICRATRSLPTPLSPVISTLAGLSAARSAIESSSVMARLATTNG